MHGVQDTSAITRIHDQKVGKPDRVIGVSNAHSARLRVHPSSPTFLLFAYIIIAMAYTCVCVCAGR